MIHSGTFHSITLQISLFAAFASWLFLLAPSAHARPNGSCDYYDKQVVNSDTARITLMRCVACYFADGSSYESCQAILQ